MMEKSPFLSAIMNGIEGGEGCGRKWWCGVVRERMIIKPFLSPLLVFLFFTKE